ncbi:MAG: LVIVD repeat-containing protein, partial [Myxococcota bacterium]
TDEATSVRIWDVGDPASPALLSTIDVPVDDAHRLAVRDDLLVLASTYNDVFAFWDVSDPASPARIAEWAPPVGEPHDQTFDGNRLWVAFTKGWACLDVTDPAAPVALFSAEADWEFPFVHNLAVAGSSVLMTEEKAGGTLRRWDTADLDAVTLTDSYQTHPDRSVHDVFVAGETAYAAWFNDGLLLFDLAGELVPVASYDTYEGDESAAGDGTANSHGASGVWADGDLVAVADTERGLLIFTY